MSATTKTLMHTDGRSGYESAAMIAALHALEDMCGYARGTLTITQFGYMGNSSFSGSTHGKDAADLSYSQHDKKSRNGRRLGIWVAPRTVADGGGTWSIAHCHAGLIGGATNTAAMNGQIAEYLRGGDGLNGSKPDREWRPRYPDTRFVYGAKRTRWTAIRATQGYDQAGGHSSDKKGAKRTKGYTTGNANIATVKVNGAEWLVFASGVFFRKADFKAHVPAPSTVIRSVTLNVADKMPNQAKRAKQNAAAIRKANVTIANCQECTGRGTESVSDYARSIDTALGAHWQTIKPKLGLNENYIWYLNTEWELVKQLSDLVLRPAGSPGRHATRAILKNRHTGFRLLAINTHLVENGDGGDRSKYRQAMGKLIADSIVATRKTEKIDGEQVSGDMNTTDDIKALLEIGLVNTRKKAIAKTHADRKTFRSGKTSGTPARGLPIDHTYVSEQLVNGYTVAVDAEGADHVPVVVSYTTTP